MATKRKAAAMSATAEEDDEPVDPSDELVFTGLGGCQEVGRSCHVLQYKGKTVMVSERPSSVILLLTIVQLDAGMHTGREGMSAMPYFDDFDLSTVDILLISQYVSRSLVSVIGVSGIEKKSCCHHIASSFMRDTTWHGILARSIKAPPVLNSRPITIIAQSMQYSSTLPGLSTSRLCTILYCRSSSY